MGPESYDGSVAVCPGSAGVLLKEGCETMALTCWDVAAQPDGCRGCMIETFLKPPTLTGKNIGG